MQISLHFHPRACSFVSRGAIAAQLFRSHLPALFQEIILHLCMRRSLSSQRVFFEPFRFQSHSLDLIVMDGAIGSALQTWRSISALLPT